LFVRDAKFGEQMFACPGRVGRFGEEPGGLR
jgi:hypothetical protein